MPVGQAVTATRDLPPDAVVVAGEAAAERVAKDDNIQFYTIVGNDTAAIGLAKAAKEIGYAPELVLFEANFYTDAMVAAGNSDATQGFTVRTAYAPFTEPEKFPGMKSYLDMMAKYKPDGKIAGLGLQATSAYLISAAQPA